MPSAASTTAIPSPASSCKVGGVAALLDYFLSSSRASLPLDGPLYRAAALATSEALLAWGHCRAQNVRLVGTATGMPGQGSISRQASRLEIEEDPEHARAACAAAGMSPLATSLAVSLSAGLCRALSNAGGYEGVADGVGSGFDRSAVEVLAPVDLAAALAARFVAAGAGGPSGQVLVPNVCEILLLTLQRARGFAVVRGDVRRGWAQCGSVSVLHLLE